MSAISGVSGGPDTCLCTVSVSPGPGCKDSPLQSVWVVNGTRLGLVQDCTCDPLLLTRILSNLAASDLLRFTAPSERDKIGIKFVCSCIKIGKLA